VTSWWFTMTGWGLAPDRFFDRSGLTRFFERHGLEMLDCLADDRRLPPERLDPIRSFPDWSGKPGDLTLDGRRRNRRALGALEDRFPGMGLEGDLPVA